MRIVRDCKQCNKPVVGCATCEGIIFSWKNYFCSEQCFLKYTEESAKYQKEQEDR